MSQTPSRATGDPAPSPKDPSQNSDPATGPHRDPLSGTCSRIDQQLRTALRLLAPNLRRHSLSPGARIFGVGAPVGAVSIIERGLVALRSPGSATLMLLRDSGTLGDVEVMTETRAEKEATVLLDTDIVRIPGEEFRWLLQRSPEFALRWSDAMACRMAAYERRLLDLLAGDLRAQVSSLLLHEFADSDVTRLTHSMIAELLGVQRSSITRVVSQLVGHDIIESGYAHMRLRDRAALARAALGYSAARHT